MVGKKRIYLVRNTLHRQSVGRLGRWDGPEGGVASYYGSVWEGYSRCFGAGSGDFQDLDHRPLVD